MVSDAQAMVYIKELGVYRWINLVKDSLFSDIVGKTALNLVILIRGRQEKLQIVKR